MARVELKKIHRVRRKLSNGTFRRHHYAWRGGPKFWSSDTGIAENSPGYIAALVEATTITKPGGKTVPEMVDAFIDSPEFQHSLAARTKADYRKWALRFAKEFADDPAALFEEPDSRTEVNNWRKAWSHSPKQYDYAGTVVARVLNWARDERIISEHHCDRFKKLYEVDRSEIIWPPGDVDTFNDTAPRWVRRILTAALETGLRPGDLIRLSRNHIEPTPEGRRIRIKTNKKGRTATIPLTPAMAALVDATPRGQLLILLSERGKPLTEHRASEGVRQWRDKAGLSSELRLQDARGTAATRLLRAGCTLGQIAANMAWSLRYAGAVIERYAAISPDESDEILTLLSVAKGREAGTKL